MSNYVILISGTILIILITLLLLFIITYIQYRKKNGK